MIVEQRILVIGPNWLGDVVMTQGLLKLLASSSSGSHIDVWSPAWAEPVYQRMPEVSRVIINPFAHGALALKQRFHCGKSLRQNGYTQAIVIPNSWKSAWLPWAAKIPQRTGWLGEQRYGLLNDYRRLNKRVLPRMSQRLAALALPANSVLPQSLPLPELQHGMQPSTDLLARYGIEDAERVIAFCPGAALGDAKCWPVEYFAELIDAMTAQGYQAWLLGATADQAKAASILSLVKSPCVNLVGRTTLVDAIDLLALTQAVVSNDSGLLHVAAAVGVPVLGLYGATPPTFAPPLSTRAAVLWQGLPCSPCFKRQCPLGHHRCLRDMVPQRVQQRLLELLVAVSSSSGKG